jgi:hypothetical protein
MHRSLNDNLTPEQFEEMRQSGSINPDATWEDYLELLCERAAAAQEAAATGLTGDAPPELTAEDEAILLEVWAEARAERETVASTAPVSRAA